MLLYIRSTIKEISVESTTVLNKEDSSQEMSLTQSLNLFQVLLFYICSKYYYFTDNLE